MAFTRVFYDSFDHYQFASQKYSGATLETDLTGTQSRTGPGALSLTTAGGAALSFPTQDNCVIGLAYKPSNLSVRDIVWFRWNAGADILISFSKNPDGSITALWGNPPFRLTIGTSIPGVLVAGTYNYLEFTAYANDVPDVHVIVRVNGVTVLDVTTNVGGSGTYPFDAFQLVGEDNDYVDDLYFGYSTDVNDLEGAFQGAIRVVAYAPDADETPLDWTPLSGSNWENVSIVPPPGDTDYNSASVVGDTDQYELAQIPGYSGLGTFTITGGQVNISARIDSAGSAAIAPNIGGNTGTSQAVTSNYHIYHETYEDNPDTGLPFTEADFATTFFGPEITA